MVATQGGDGRLLPLPRARVPLPPPARRPTTPLPPPVASRRHEPPLQPAPPPPRRSPPRRPLLRALPAAAASALVPGTGQAVQRRWRAAALFGTATAAMLAGGAWLATRDRTTLVTWSTDRSVLRGLFLAGLVWAVVCAVAAADAAAASRPSIFRRPARPVLGAAAVVVVMLAATVPGVAAGWAVLRQDALLDRVFVGGGDAEVARPSSLAELGVTTTAAPATTAPATTAPVTAAPRTTATTTAAPAPTTAAPTTPAPATAAPAAPAGRWTVALLGGDAGPYRWGLRTDTMVVVSIDRGTGDLVSISVPRNLQHLPMPAGPLRRLFPNGFTDLANALYPFVATRPQLGLDPAQSVKGALAELLGIPIDNYVLVDMTGFVRIIDALGGVDVELSRKVRLIPNMDRQTREALWVGPGPVHMNGAMALAFARTREQDSDYQRMGRQRCLLAAVARTTSAGDLVRSYPALASAVEDAFRSDIPRERLGDVVRLFAKVDVGRARGLVLVPPVIRPGSPDIARVRALVATLLDPAAASQERAVTAPAC